MANNRISVVVDLAIDGANRGLKSFQSSIKDADGAVGKFKAGAASAFGSIKANAGEFAVAAGAALVAFGVKSVNAFNDLAIESGKLSDALGMPVEDASRLVEVAGDVGIEMSALESTIGKMNRTAASTPKAFDDIGAAIAKNADGTTNVNETFLNAVDALNKIPDASKRAEAAQKIFGKSWMDIAELVGQGSDDIRESLGAVSDAKIIDEEEVAKARRFRAAMDDLAEAAEGATLVIGEALVPIVAELVETANRAKGSFAGFEIPPAVKASFGFLTDHFVRFALWPKMVLDYSDAWTKVVGPIEVVAEALKQVAVNNAVEGAKDKVVDFGKAVGDATVATDESTEAIAHNAEALDDHMSASDLAAAKLDHLGRRWDALTGNLSNDSALLDIEEGFESVETAALEAFAAAKTGAADAAQKSRDYQREVIAQKLRIAEYVEGLGQIEPEKLTSINAAIDKGDYDLAEWALAQLTRERFVSISPSVGAGRAAASSGAGQGAPRRIHDGGIAGGGSFAGLKPDEVPAILQKGEAVLTKPQQAALGGGGGNTYHTIINVPHGWRDADDVTNASRRYGRIQGPT